MTKWPNTDLWGRQVKDGDLVSLPNGDQPFIAYLDGKSRSLLRHPALTAQQLARWVSAPNWTGMQLLCRDAEFGLGRHPKPMPRVVDQNHQHGGSESL